MNVTGEFALLVVVVLPIAVVAAMNLLLALGGERDTLMLPLGAMSFPAIHGPAPRVELGCPRAELVDTGAHPVYVPQEEEWRKAA